MKRFDAAAAAAGVLFIVYALNLAPSVTFWDAGEFIAAAHSLGIPHPPGTPLFVLLLNVWMKVLPLPAAVATNLFSAAVTALAACITARIVHRATENGYMAFAAALVAGGMSSVWINATETEVYGASLGLALLTIWAGDRAGREVGHERWTCLTAYLIGLAVPLHLSALVAAPVAILLAGYTPAGIRWHRVTALAGVFVFAMGVGRVDVWTCVVGAAVALSAVAVNRTGRITERVGLPIAMLALAMLASSALAFMYVRAQFDPAINQGNPNTLAALADIVARKQYAVSPMWPREAPIWLQLGNLGQYADWQVALSLGPTVDPSVLRSIGTVIFLALGYVGAVEHWRLDRRTWLAVFALLLCGALGVLVYLNLHAGPSIGYGLPFLSENIVREARERDYFFVFGFWAWGTWAGIGAVRLASHMSRPAWSGVLVAFLPIILNWRAVTRSIEPERSLPLHVAEAMLESTPSNGVLFVGGDNDTYPLWYAQRVRRIRTDVALVTIPLLPTRWYRAEIARRHGLIDSTSIGRFEGRLNAAADIADGARRLGRPVAASMTLTPRAREALGGNWVAGGLAYVEGSGSAAVDDASALRWASWIDDRVSKRPARPAVDPVNSYFLRMLDCPRQFATLRQTADTSRLDSACNYR